MSAKVLLVEDDVTLRTLYEERFKLEGYEVIIAGDGEEGVAKAKIELPDIILLDLRIPKMSGLEVLRVLRNFEKTREIPILVLTALFGPDQKRCIELGATGFFNKSKTKPLELVEKVGSLLNK